MVTSHRFDAGLRSPRFLIALGLAVLLGGCQSGGGTAGAPPAAANAVTAVVPVLVTDFDVDAMGIRRDSSVVGQVVGGIAGDGTPFAEGAVNLFADRLVAELLAAGIPAERLRPGSPPPARGWLVRGRFTSLDEGQTGVQSLIGFGAGNPDVAVVGEVVDLALPGRPPVIYIGDEADGRPMPGGLISRNPALIALKTLRATGSFEREIANLAENVAETIAQEMAIRLPGV